MLRRSRAALTFAVLLGFAVSCSDGPDRALFGPDPDPGQATGPLMSVGGGDDSPASTASVVTDKDDYQPGDTVTITGAGWWPDETVRIHISEEPPNHPDWEFNVVADEAGAFVHRDLVMDEDHLGVTFTLTATGQASGMVAGAVFTDNHAMTLESVSPSHGPTTGGTLVTITGAGFAPGGNSTYKVTFGDAEPITATHGSDSELTVVAPPHIAGVVNVTVTATSTSGAHAGEFEDTLYNAFTYTDLAEDPRTTATTLVCSPATVAIDQPTTCTATVTDTGDGDPTDPEGIVTFSSDADGTFDGGENTCTLDGAGDGTSSCSVTYTPSVAGSHGIGANYDGSEDHEGGSDSFELTATKRATNTALECVPNPVVVNQATTCTVTVTDASPGTTSEPEGDAAFSATGGGSGDFSAPTCELVGNEDDASSSCSVGFTPSAAGDPSIEASYQGSDRHDADDATFELTVDRRATQTTVTCDKGEVVVNESTACTVQVKDAASAGTAAPPDGTVQFSVSGGNSSGDDFSNGGSCELEASGVDTSTCEVSYTPQAASTHTIRADYPQNDVHDPSDDAFPLTVHKRATETTVTCTPGSADVNDPAGITCEAKVTDAETGGSSLAPTGYVEFLRNGEAAGSCTLVPDDAASSTCTYGPFTSTTTTLDAIVAKYTGSNAHEGSQSDPTYIAFYDPSAGFVTGGGWIWSPKYAYAVAPDLEGRANFGFVSQYQKRGKNDVELTGNTQFVFHAGDLNFHSESYEWLVVQTDAKAMFKGTGRLNGVSGYGFIISVEDGAPDRFRIRITDPGGSLVYDNQPGSGDNANLDQDGTIVQGGSIVIHTGGNGNGKGKNK